MSGLPRTSRARAFSIRTMRVASIVLAGFLVWARLNWTASSRQPAIIEAQFHAPQPALIGASILRSVRSRGRTERRMDAPMRAGCGAWNWASIIAGCLLLAVQLSLAQTKKPASTIEATRIVLIEKARALDVRGRPDMAVQLWQQILFSDPDNTEA